MKRDICYCADAEFCPLRDKCVRADVPNWHISLSNFYEQHILSCEEWRCQYYVPKYIPNMITNGYQKSIK